QALDRNEPPGVHSEGPVSVGGVQLLLDRERVVDTLRGRPVRSADSFAANLARVGRSAIPRLRARGPVRRAPGAFGTVGPPSEASKGRLISVAVFPSHAAIETTEIPAMAIRIRLSAVIMAVSLLTLLGAKPAHVSAPPAAVAPAATGQVYMVD